MFTKGLVLKVLLQGHRAPNFWLLLGAVLPAVVVASWLGHREEQADKAAERKFAYLLPL